MTVTNFWTCVSGGNHERPFFCTHQGKAIDSSSVGSALSTIWKRAGLTTKIGSTILRKTITTIVHRSHGHLKEATARQLCHSETTAASEYKFQTRRKQAVQTTKALKKALRREEIVHTSSVEDRYAPSLQGENVLSLGLDTVHALKDSALATTERKRSKTHFTDQDRNFFSFIFAPFIKSKKVPSLEVIRDMAKKHNFAGVLGPRCVLDKIPGCIRGLIARKK